MLVTYIKEKEFFHEPRGALTSWNPDLAMLQKTSVAATAASREYELEPRATSLTRSSCKMARRRFTAPSSSGCDGANLSQ